MTTITFDNFNNVIAAKEYDFGGTDGSLGPLVRQTLRTYGAAIGSNYGISINGYCYSNLNPADSSCGSGLAADVTSIIYQRGVLLNETIKDGSDNPKAYAEFEYDNYASDSNHAAVAINAGMIQYDGSRFCSFSTSNQPRGNVTKAMRWSGGSNYLSAFSHYNNAGEVVWAKDPNGNVSTVSYGDNFGDGSNPESGSGGTNGATYAFASVVTNALGQQAKSQFDYTRGVPTGTKDPNGVIAKTEYDSLGRPFRATAAVGLAEQTIAETTYPTATANVATASRQLDATRWLASKTVLDGFDRPVTSWQAEDGQHASAANFTIRGDVIYDALGRVKQSSNPYRQGESAVYTTSVYDLAGRVTSITTPDNAAVSTYYSANQVLVKDQADKERMSQTNALGQLTDVWEITPADQWTEAVSFPGHQEVNAGYHTTYAYDALSDLISVTQGNQPQRSFQYDSLKRLTSATNPESGTICYGTVVSRQCQANGYDANGNLVYKTDARGVLTSYGYDALNRNYSITYTNDPANTPAVTRTYDNPTIGAFGIGRIWKTQTSANTLVTIDNYDPLGRPKSQGQQFYYNNAWTQPYSITSITYDRANHILNETYPSGRTVTNAYDGAGRLSSFSGNLGDGGTTRTYSSITGSNAYDAAGHWTREQFGTDTPLYNKRHYNIRQQLYDMRLSTLNDDSDGDRGAIVNYYSLSNYGFGTTGTDTNGNLYVQQHRVPDGQGGFTIHQQNYSYDSLNRINWMAEYLNGATGTGSQTYSYDRYGNRTISGGWGTGTANQQFSVDLNTNRLGVPSGQSGTMTYDPAGNLTNDTYSGEGQRTYDAENHMKQAWANSQWQTYTYDGDGRRVKRDVNGTETWQVYGLGGELLAEYGANAAPTSPQKEYGYRHGELLVTADAPRTNVALAANGATASASSYFTWGGSITCPPASAIDGERKGLNWGYSGFWSDATGNAYPDWLEVDFAGSKTIDEIDLYTAQDNYTNPAEPTESMTFSLYGLTGFEVQYWNGSGWTDIPGGNVTGNNKVWRKFTFSAITTTKLRVVTSGGADGYSRIMELEAWGANGGVGGTNGYSYRRTITIDHNKVPNTDQSNFPVLVSGTYSYLATVANGGNVQNSNGYDVIFTSDPGCATKLSHEVETYNATSGAVNYWVKAPTVSHATDITLYMCYGNSSITTDQSNKTAVWDSNFVSVYHLPNGSTLNTNDSTSNANNGANSGATATTGQIDGGGSFDGSSQAININHPSVFNFGNGDYTFEAWIKPTNNSVGRDFLSKDASGARQFCFQMGTNGGAGSLNFIHFNGDGTLYWRAGQNSSIATGSWSHVVAVRSGSSLILYVNATSQTLSDPYSNGPLGTMASTATDALIGRRAYSGFENYFNGSIDEVRISNTARSADWLQTEYNNQNSPATFYSISAATVSAPPTASIHWLVTDQLGTPRMIFDQSGSLANVSRHDYLPFGEELFAGVSNRTPQQGYTGDSVRQHFTLKERDNETGLDYFLARYYSSTQGRFTSADEFKGGPEELFEDVDPHDPLFYADVAEPQSLNKYHYCLNNPLRYIDPDGHQTTVADRLRNAASSAAGVLQRTINGASSALAEDNGLGPNDGAQNKVGRALGHGVALAQSGAEIAGGVIVAVEGGGEAVVTAPACSTGVGCAVPAVGVTAVVVGAVGATHGTLVGINTFRNILSKNSSQQSSGAKSASEYDKHAQGVQNAKQEAGQLKEQLSKTRGPTSQAPIKEKIQRLEKSIRGHEKEMRQKWPKGRPETQ